MSVYVIKDEKGIEVDRIECYDSAYLRRALKKKHTNFQGTATSVGRVMREWKITVKAKKVTIELANYGRQAKETSGRDIVEQALPMIGYETNAESIGIRICMHANIVLGHLRALTDYGLIAESKIVGHRQLAIRQAFIRIK